MPLGKMLYVRDTMCYSQPWSMILVHCTVRLGRHRIWHPTLWWWSMYCNMTISIHHPSRRNIFLRRVLREGVQFLIYINVHDGSVRYVWVGMSILDRAFQISKGGFHVKFYRGRGSILAKRRAWSNVGLGWPTSVTKLGHFRIAVSLWIWFLKDTLQLSTWVRHCEVPDLREVRLSMSSATYAHSFSLRLCLIFWLDLCFPMAQASLDRYPHSIPCLCCH